ncbi:MAG: hypothetical protein EAZ36_02085, partial [Verrucomicrobia bacterium]
MRVPAPPLPRLPRPRRGSVIVVVLVMILLTSLMLVKFMETSAVELTLATHQADRTRLRADAYSALETLLAVMAEIKALDEDRLNAPEQGWGDPYAYAGESPREGVTVAFKFTDESGKGSLPTLSFDDMVELAQALGLTETDARRFADGLFAWTRADHVAQDTQHLHHAGQCRGEMGGGGGSDIMASLKMYLYTCQTHAELILEVFNRLIFP